MPGYGFTKDGFVSYKKAGYKEWDEQRGLALSEKWFEDQLSKAEYDEDKHPRDPQTGQYVEVDAKGYFASDDEAAAQAEEYLDYQREKQAEVAGKELELAIQAIKRNIAMGIMPLDPTRIERMLKAQRLWPKQPAAQQRILQQLGVLSKAQIIPKFHSAIVRDVGEQLMNEIIRHGDPDHNPITPIPNFNKLLHGYKMYNHGEEALALKYMIHRFENMHRYDSDEGADQADADFLRSHRKVLALKKRNPARDALDQQLLAKHPNVHSLRQFMLNHLHLASDLIAHRESLHDALRLSGKLVYPFATTPGGREGGPHIVAVRALNSGNNFRPRQHVKANHMPDPVLASYQDTTDNTIGGSADVFHYHHVPLDNVWVHYDHADTDAWFDRNRAAEDELLISPHTPIGVHPQDAELLKLIPRKPRPKKKKANAPVIHTPEAIAPTAHPMVN